jgi:hypothetical protein
MKHKYDVVASMGKYTDKKTGEEKYKNQKIGVIVEKDNGHLDIKLELVPVGWNGWASLYPAKMNEGQYQQAKESVQAAGGFEEDSIPF